MTVSLHPTNNYSNTLTYCLTFTLKNFPKKKNKKLSIAFSVCAHYHMSCNFCLTHSVLQHHTRLLLCVPMPSCFKSHTHDCSFSVSICNVAGRFVQLFAETCNLCQEINTPSGTMAKKIKKNYTLSRKKKD